jgi:phospholipid/cholesterol/gamma-HCH transport system substrate-binding protein
MNTRFVGFRYTHEAVGALVVVTVLLFVLALMQADRMRAWFDPATTIRVILPAEGVFGLTEGARVEILGTKAGDVRKIVLDPEQTLHAEIFVRKAMLAFVRRDSQAIIRKQFGVAGASYLEITRGSGAPLDREYAVLTAIADRAPTDAMSELIAELRSRVFPLIADAQVTLQAFTALAQSAQGPIDRMNRVLTDLTTITARLERGEGSVGRLLTEETAARDLETLLEQTSAHLQNLGMILTDLAATAHHTADWTATLHTYTDGVAQLTKRVNAMLVPLQRVLEDLRQTTPELPRLSKNLADTTEGLPLMLLQTTQSLDSLERLLKQLRSHWLLGGRRSEATQDSSRRLPVLDITP